MNICVKAFEIMKIIEEHDDYNSNDIMIIKSLTYYKSEFLTNGWILSFKYLYKNFIKKKKKSLQKSITII